MCLNADHQQSHTPPRTYHHQDYRQIDRLIFKSDLFPLLNHHVQFSMTFIASHFSLCLVGFDVIHSIHHSAFFLGLHQSHLYA